MITLNLELDEVNGVLAALGNMPFIQVRQLIGKIQEQANPQVAAIQSSNAANVQKAST